MTKNTLFSKSCPASREGRWLMSKKEEFAFLVMEVFFLEIGVYLDERVIGVIEQELEILEELILVGGHQVPYEGILLRWVVLLA